MLFLNSRNFTNEIREKPIMEGKHSLIKYTQHYAQHDIVTPAQNPQLVTSQIEEFSYMDDSIFLNATAPNEVFRKISNIKFLFYLDQNLNIFSFFIWTNYNKILKISISPVFCPIPNKVNFHRQHLDK